MKDKMKGLVSVLLGCAAGILGLGLVFLACDHDAKVAQAHRDGLVQQLVSSSKKFGVTPDKYSCLSDGYQAVICTVFGPEGRVTLRCSEDACVEMVGLK
jgi:hypothetical protein